MKTKAAYLVIDTQRRIPTIVRTTQLWPALQAGEIVVRVALEVSDAAIPQAQVVVVDDPGAIVVTALPVAVEPPDEEVAVA